MSWSTIWNWQNGPNAVKSYANVEHQTAKGMKVSSTPDVHAIPQSTSDTQLSTISTMPSSWNWQYQTVSSGVRADVS